MERKKQSFDLSTLPVRPIAPEFQTIVLVRTGTNGMSENSNFYIITPDVPQQSRLFASRSLRYACHATDLGVTGPQLLQLSLEICLRLYSVSRAISFHRDFAGQYLIDLPTGNFKQQLTVPI
jgi:hypothetical protein